MGNVIVHFEVYADDVDRAIGFYRTVLGWEFQRIEEMNYTLVFPSGEVSMGPAAVGINGGIVLRPGPAPADDRATPNAFVCTVAVDDVHATLASVEANGGRIDMPVMEVEGVGQLAYVRDTERNVLGVLQPLPRDAA